MEGIAFVTLSSCAPGKFLQKESWFFLCLKTFCKNLLNVVLSLVLWTWQLVNKETQDSSCITKNFFTGFMAEFTSKLHLFKLPNRISSPSWCIPVTACFIICEVSLFVSAVKYWKAIMLVTYASLASQWMKVNQWIALDTGRLSSQSERATLSNVLVYTN